MLKSRKSLSAVCCWTEITGCQSSPYNELLLLLKTLWPENTSSHISRHLEFIIEQGHGSTGSLGHWIPGSLGRLVTKCDPVPSVVVVVVVIVVVVVVVVVAVAVVAVVVMVVVVVAVGVVVIASTMCTRSAPRSSGSSSGSKPKCRRCYSSGE